jgi:archaeal flagellin FlaB
MTREGLLNGNLYTKKDCPDKPRKTRGMTIGDRKQLLNSTTTLIINSDYMSFKNSDAFTGLEAAIVLIAFVVVAAVFSYVVLGAGFFTTQKSQQTIYKGVEQATSNIQMMGQVYGTNSGGGDDTTIKAIEFSIGLAPGAPSIDLSKMIIVVAQPGYGVITQNTYSTVASAQTFSSTDAQSGTPLPTLSGQQQAKIKFEINPVIRRNGEINIEIRPGVGAPMPFTRQAPATIMKSQILT